MTLTSAGKQLLWMEHLFQELDLASSEPPHLLCDNLQAITNVHNGVYDEQKTSMSNIIGFARELLFTRHRSLTSSQRRI